MNRLFKFTVVGLIIILLLIAFVGCASNNTQSEPVTMKVATLKGPTGMGMVKLMEDNEKNEGDINYEFIVSGAPDELAGKVIKGEVDIAALPTNLASVIYNKTQGQIKLAAINTMGVLYILENGNEINSIADLKGKKIYASGKGATPDYVLRYILKKNGIDPEKDVEIDFSMQHADLSAMVTAGDAEIALLPQPHATIAQMKNKDVRIALDMTEEWDKISGDESKLAMGCIVVQKEFAEKNKEAFDKFLEKYKASVNWVNSNQADAGALVEKYGILPKAKLAEKAIPKCNIVFMDAKESKNILDGFYKILFDFNPKSVGGKLPDEEFYYMEK
ncbi:ABC transporter substrate-binding protein [Paramaledivibacter caminithermalis]|uniref:NitT/TauT family transport system substrate-binding protein n=1 Tax=Paramaledivibacter caminithermalis (strain DSM 15212 / CIP 107654 / DViRD3) TaxID=1121301 RepID=A0A1M6P1Z4_PARC5|nr:ABC transporter substrate-binding protein [Paramaledivibacter caminithermalis]SHK02037.1 NitT/TauT family transport system substrate-binding protein [Paramaledivibacter caminithermalis DSM 15212]